MRTKLSHLVAASAALALTAGAAFAAPVVIYQDDFSGGTGDLNGVAPDTGANNWVAASMFNADGSIVDDAGAGVRGGSATLAFTPEQGLIYTLDMSLTSLSGNNNWIGLGFADGQWDAISANNRFINEPTGGDPNNTIGRAWMLFRADPTLDSHFASMNGTSDHVGWSPTFTSGDGAVDLRIVLDTTGGDGNWEATWYAKQPAASDYTVVRATADIVTEDITSVGLVRSNNGAEGIVTSFSLTSVPEPSSLALLGLSGLCVLRRRRN